MVERDEQLTELTRRFVETTASTGRLVVVEGTIGSGKTEVLHAFRAWAAMNGAIVSSAGGSQVEHELPMGVVSQLLHGLPAMSDPTAEAAEAPTAAARAARHLDRAMVSSPAADADPKATRRLFAPHLPDIHAAIVAAAARGPVVLTVDDSDLADDASWHCLLYLVRRSHHAPVMVVLAESPTVRPPSRHRLDLLREHHGTRVRLRPLTRVAVGRVITARTGAEPPAEATAICATVSGGNPLLLAAMLDDVAATGIWAAGPALGFAWLSCLNRFGDAAVALARATAVLGEPAAEALAPRLAGIGDDTAVTVRRSLNDAGLFDDGRFRCPSARTAVLEDLGPDERFALRHRAARLLYDAGAPLSTISEHLLLAGPSRVADENVWASALLRDAADTALAADDITAARACLDGMSRVEEEPSMSAVILRATLASRIDSGSLERHATTIAELIELTGPAAVPIDDLVIVTRILLRFGLGTTAIRVVAHHLRRANLDPETHATLQTGRRIIVNTRPQLAGQAPEPAEHGAATASDALGALLAGEPEDAAARIAERALANWRLQDDTSHSLAEAILVLLYTGHTGRADSVCSALRSESVRRGAAGWQASFEWVAAEIALHRGALRDAATHASAALGDALDRPGGWDAHAAGPLAVLLMSNTWRGLHADARDLLDKPAPPGLFQDRLALHHLRARGLHHLAGSQHHAAIEDFAACGELMTGWGVDRPTIVPWRTDLAEAHLQLGDRQEAARLADEQLALLGPSATLVRGSTQRVRAAAGPAHQRIGTLRASAELLRAGGYQLELARTLGDLGAALKFAGQTGHARRMVRRAWEIARSCAAQPLCESLVPLSGHLADRGSAAPQTDTAGRGAGGRGAGGRAGESDPGGTDAGGTGADGAGTERETAAGTSPRRPAGPEASALTRAEHRVALLAANGHTNSSIAGKLYVSVSTVEQHLTRVYRKLDVRGRDGLRAALTTDQGADVIDWDGEKCS